MKNVLLIFGGKSAEHEISIRSARNVMTALDKERFNPICVAISRSGCWYLFKEGIPAGMAECTDGINSNNLCNLMLTPHSTVLTSHQDAPIQVDIVFPIIHGPMGEDGTLQGLLEMMNVPYVGCGVLSSAAGMDKEILKKLLINANVPVVPFVTMLSHVAPPSYQEVAATLASDTLFIKPARMGSSVGIYKVVNQHQYWEALNQAFKYDCKVLVEKYIPCKEVECAVLGNLEPEASCVGEIKPTHEFYSYEAKYLDPTGAELIIPADLPPTLIATVRELAVRAFKAIECKGLARVDFFISHHRQVYVNELNTMPGFTSISMYPKLWESSGLSYQQLISNLLSLALEEYHAKQQIHLRPTLEVCEPLQKMATS